VFSRSRAVSPMPHKNRNRKGRLQKKRLKNAYLSIRNQVQLGGRGQKNLRKSAPQPTNIMENKKLVKAKDAREKGDSKFRQVPYDGGGY